MPTMRRLCPTPAYTRNLPGNATKQAEKKGKSALPETYRTLKETATFVDVKKTATTIQQLQYGVSASYENKGLIILKDVPIQWDVEP